MQRNGEPRPTRAPGDFDSLYQELARAWESHQQLRSTYPDVPTLAASAAELDEARSSMWDWWRENRIVAR